MDKDKPDDKPDIIVEFEDDNQQPSLFDDAPPEKPKKPAKKADKSDDAEPEAVVQMRRQLEAANAASEAERQKRIAAEKAAADRAAELENERKERRAVEGSSIEAQKQAAQAAADSLQAQLIKALEDGEYAKASELQRKLSRAEAVLLRLDEQEADHKERDAEPAPKPDKKADTTAEPRAPSNVEEWLSQVQLPDRAKQFFRDHPEFAPINKSLVKHHMLNATHAEALEQGITFDSPAYYNFLNKRLIDTDDADTEDDDDMDKESEPPRRVAAPVSRGEAGRGSDTPQRIRLSREEREMADALGMSPEKYARHMLTGKKEGRIT